MTLISKRLVTIIACKKANFKKLPQFLLQIDPFDVQSTVIINIAEAIDRNSGVRFRECFLGEYSTSLNAVLLPQFVTTDEWNNFVESINAPAKLQDILRSNTLEQSSENLISWTDYKNNCVDRETGETCQTIELN